MATWVVPPTNPAAEENVAEPTNCKWVVHTCYVKATLDGKIIRPLEVFGLAVVGEKVPPGWEVEKDEYSFAVAPGAPFSSLGHMARQQALLH